MKKEIKIGETIIPIEKIKTGQIIVVTSNQSRGNKEGTITKVIKSVAKRKKELINRGFSKNCLLAEARSSIQNSLHNASNIEGTICWYETYVRPATEKEKRAYRKGIYSIYDM